MTLLKRDSWYVISGQTKPVIICPLCGKDNLGDPAPHGVRLDGMIYNSVICENPKCTFHDFVTLEGWDRGEILHRSMASSASAGDGE